MSCRLGREPERAFEFTISALWQVTEDQGGRESVELGNTALLALGNLGKDLRDAESESYAELSLGLKSGLATAPPESKAVFLTAISNTRDPALLEVVAPELEARDPAVRVAAARAVSSMDRPESLDVLASRIEQEDNAWARAALVDGLGELSYTSDATFAACASMLASEEDMKVRAAVARYLGTNLENYPAGREPLEALLRDRDNSAELRAYVAKTLRR